MAVPKGHGLAALVDHVMPGPGSVVDAASGRLQRSIARLLDGRAGRLTRTVLRGNDWLGHPAHPIAATVPIGAWVVGAVFDLRSSPGGRPVDEHAADTALWIGNLGAVPAAAMGIAQFLDTSGSARRQTAVHAALNNVGLTLNLLSQAARALGRRRAGRRLSMVALGVVGLSGFLGADLAYRHGVGVSRTADPPAAEPAALDAAVAGDLDGERGFVQRIGPDPWQ